MMLDAGLEPRVLTLEWCWDASLEPRILTLEWCWTRASSRAFWHWSGAGRRPRASRFGTGVVLDAGLEPHVLISLASEVWTMHWMTCLQWYLDSLQNLLQSFWNSAVDWDDFRNTLDFSLGNGLSRLDWQSSEIPWAWSCLDPSLREYTVKLFEATRDDRREYLDAQSRPHRCSELVVGILSNRGK